MARAVSHGLAARRSQRRSLPGRVALLQSRWNWLKQNPEETAEIILRSATDLGAPGVDGTYGWGLLNVAASQAPLNPDALFCRDEVWDHYQSALWAG